MIFYVRCQCVYVCVCVIVISFSGMWLIVFVCAFSISPKVISLIVSIAFILFLCLGYAWLMCCPVTNVIRQCFSSFIDVFLFWHLSSFFVIKLYLLLVCMFVL